MIFNALAPMTGRQAKGQSTPANTVESAYIHVPFCRHRCGYCSFTLIAGREDLVEQYLVAVDRELEMLGGPHPVTTLYFGGGTPSHLTPDQFQRLAESARRHLPLLPDYEWSLEANPSDIDASLVNLWADLGVTRISLGAQSFDPDKLKRLERDHSADTIRNAVEVARRRIPNISLDLIFAVPGETLVTWCADLQEALKLAPDHISTYGLTYERGARFWGRRERGELVATAEELERRMYEEAITQLAEAGLEHYEVSNFARPGRKCRHNEVYWSGASYFAAGPGAASYVDGERRMNHGSTTTYLRRVLAGNSPVQHRERLGPLDRAREYLVFGLRRMAGVPRQDFQQHTGHELDLLVGPELRRFRELGLLEDDGQTIRLTRNGLFVSDAMWPYLLAR